MSNTPMWRRYLRFWGSNPRADVDAEIEHHLEALVQHLVARGMPLDQARTEALRRFGSVARVRDECLIVDRISTRVTHRRELRDALWNDLLDAGRGLTRAPGFTVGAAIILALGIGLNTATFSFNKALLFPRVPFGDPARVVRLWSQNMPRGVFANPLSEGEIADISAGTRSFETIAAYAVQPVTLTGGVEAERVVALRGTINLLPLLRVAPSLGRSFTPEDAAGDGAVVLISDRAWRNRFGSDPAVVGRSVHLDGRSHTIVGVLPEPFWFESRDIDVWLPMPLPRTDGVWDARRLMAVARLKPGVESAAAQSDLLNVTQVSAQAHPRSNAGWNVVVTGLLPFGPGETVFFALMATLTALLLAAACAHIANLLLARGIDRRGEIATRMALGAGRGRIVRQLFAESVALSLVGGALSLVVAVPLITIIRVILGPATPFLSQLALDPGALIATAGLSVLASLLFGVAPALRLSAATAADGMNQRPGAPVAGRRRPLASLLIGFEVTVATLALIVTFLFARAAKNVFAAPFGYRSEGVITFRIDAPEYKYPERQDAARLLTDIRERLLQMPGVSDAGAAVRMPLYAGPGLPPEAITIEERRDIPGEKNPWAITSIVTPGYFDALGIARIEGRTFEPRDSAGAAPGVVISRSLAKAYWPTQSAIGRRVKLANESNPWLTVIGVVDDVRQLDPNSPQVRQLYLPLTQAPVRALVFFVHTNDDPAGHARDVRMAVHDIDPDVPLLDLRTLQAAIDDTLKGQRFGRHAIQVNAVIAVFLALTGVYSVVAFASAGRRREIAIRVALGGRRAGIVAMLLGQTLRPAFIGVGVGLLLAALVSRAIATVLFGVNPLDPMTYGLSAAALCAATAMASCLPAIRATGVDAATALRSD